MKSVSGIRKLEELNFFKEVFDHSLFFFILLKDFFYFQKPQIIDMRRLHSLVPQGFCALLPLIFHHSHLITILFKLTEQ